MTEATAAALKDSDPILKGEFDTFGKDIEAASIPGANESDVATGWMSFAFLYQRSTYYWIAFIAQFAQVILQIIGFRVAGINCDKNTVFYAGLFFGTGIHSSTTVIINLVHLVGKIKGPERVTETLNAIALYRAIRICVLYNILILMLLVPIVMFSNHFNLASADDIRPIIVLLLIGSTFVAAFANIAAAYNTYVVDLDYRVPKWFPTPEEYQGFSRQNAIQLPS